MKIKEIYKLVGLKLIKTANKASRLVLSKKNK